MVCESQTKIRLFLFPQTVYDLCQRNTTAVFFVKENVNKIQHGNISLFHYIIMGAVK